MPDWTPPPHMKLLLEDADKRVKASEVRFSREECAALLKAVGKRRPVPPDDMFERALSKLRKVVRG